MSVEERLNPLYRYVPLVIWVMAMATVMAIPLKIIGQGYVPSDDANRHVAKAVSGKDWSEILVLRDGVIDDHNPGWHAILSFLHRNLGLDSDGLMAFSVAGLFGLILASGLPWVRRPEAYLGVLALASITGLNGLMRYAIGRPFLFSGAVLITILAWWTRGPQTTTPWLRYAGTTLLLALATWIHGSWYLFVLPVAGFVLAGRFRTGAALFACFVAAQPLGGSFTGQPIAFLRDQIDVLMSCFGSTTLQKFLVGEFQPSDGAPFFISLIIGFLIWRRLRGGAPPAVLRDPVFMTGLLGWVLGLHVVRFWIDWGLPAFVLWMAFEVDDALQQQQSEEAPVRVVYAGMICLALWLSCTTDSGGRWTANLHTEYLDQNNPEHAAWLPEEGGILYSDSMLVFYQTFYRNPRANWRYLLGFEATFMPEDDLAVFRDIQWNRRDARTFEPWIRKMRSEDRMVYLAPKSSPPGIEGLDWHYIATDRWIGRLPRPNDESETAGPATAAPHPAATQSDG